MPSTSKGGLSSKSKLLLIEYYFVKYIIFLVFIDAYKRSGDEECIAEKLNTAKEMSSLIKEKDENNSNRKFCEYLYTRLEEMDSETAKQKRKEMFLILED